MELLKPAPEWGPAHKVSKLPRMRPGHVMEESHVMQPLQHHSAETRLKQSSFDNPSFSIANVVYTFDNDEL